MIKAMDDTQNAPSVSQAKRIKELAQKGQFTSDAVVAIMGEEKKGELDTVTIKNDILRKYFPRSYTPRQMEEKNHTAFGCVAEKTSAWQRALTAYTPRRPAWVFYFCKKFWRLTIKSQAPK